ncbi:hydroxyacid dehydrogenase (plasmid) [Coraliomargarita sp. W4R53]
MAEPLLLDPDSPLPIDDTEVLITSWGAPRLDKAMLDRMPRLRAVLHAAGTVHGLVSDDLWERGVLVTSAADANAIPVAEFTFASVILAFKRVFTHVQQPAEMKGRWGELRNELSYGALGRTVGVVGFSRIGRRVVSMLQQLEGVQVLVADPMVDPGEVAAAGALLMPLSEMLPRVDVLTVHAPSLASTYQMIGAAELAALHDGATLINTARGALIDHDALLLECRTGRLDAILDVTDPEPLPANSEFHRLPNVAMTPHVAGSLGTEVRRLADSALDDLSSLIEGKTPDHVVAHHDLRLSA